MNHYLVQYATKTLIDWHSTGVTLGICTGLFAVWIPHLTMSDRKGESFGGSIARVAMTGFALGYCAPISVPFFSIYFTVKTFWPQKNQ